MAREDVESQVSHSENTPLLVGERSGQPRPEEQESDKRSYQWYLWRMLWALVAAVVLGVFIKGWIDADGDVNVSAATFFPAMLGL